MDITVILGAVLVLGFVLKIAGFLIRDELLLRVLVASGLVCDAAFYGLRPEPILPSVAANLGLVSINVVLIGLILSERTTWRMSRDDLDLYMHFQTLTPGQFRRLRGMARRQSVEAGTTLASEGQPVEHLMLVFSDRILITKDDESFPIVGPAFVGEIAFLTGQPSSAGVSLPEGGSVLRIDSAALKARMARSPALSNAMVALFGRELARKVADSVPMDRAARRPGAADGPAPSAPEAAHPAANPMT